MCVSILNKMGHPVIVMDNDSEFETLVKDGCETRVLDTDDIFMKSKGYTRYDYNDFCYETDKL
jgi:hypothetical protein